MKKIIVLLIAIILILITIDLFTTNYLKELYYITTGKIIEKQIKIGLMNPLNPLSLCFKEAPQGCVFIRVKHSRTSYSYLPTAFAVMDAGYDEYTCYYGCPK